jgi:outer membrane protein TolC
MVTLLFLFFARTDAHAEIIKLSAKSVAEMVLQKGPRASEINSIWTEQRLGPALVQANFDWNVNVEADYENDKSEFFYPFPNIPGSTYKRYYTTLSLKKSLPTGTSLGVDYSRISQGADFNLNSPNPFGILPQETQDAIGITVEQSLLRNFFGRADRARIKSADLALKSEEFARADRLQNLALDALRSFWDAYVARENFRVALASRDRYQALVTQVHRKTGEGYGAPGELSQAQAEREAQEQNVKLASLTYLKAEENLTTLLGLSKGTQIDFDVATDIGPAPSLPPVNQESLRAIEAQNLRVESAREGLKVARSESYPDITLIGKAYSTGMDQVSDASLSTMGAGSHPRYYAGVKFNYHFGANVQAESVLNKQSAKELEETRLLRQKMEQADQLTQTERKVQAEFDVAQSAKKQKDFRERAVHELDRSYNMGRTDIRLLIDAINAQFGAEVGMLRAVGDYQIALNELAALRDELIPKIETEE